MTQNEIIIKLKAVEGTLNALHQSKEINNLDALFNVNPNT